MTQEPEIRPCRSRIPISIWTGIAVAVLSVLAAWLHVRGGTVYGQRHETLLSMARLSSRVAQHHNRTGSRPTSILELEALWGSPNSDRSQEDLPPKLDGWGHALRFEFSEDRFDVVSLGRDGVPGGRGLAFDLRLSEIDNEHEYLFPFMWFFKPPAAKLTLLDFVLHSPSEGSLLTALLSGVAASALSYRQLRIRNRETSSRTAVVFGFSLFLAAALSILHAPDVRGH